MHAKPLYCSQCGAGSLEYRAPEGDAKRRHCCARCGYIIYQNPLVVAGAILEWQGGLLLCRRSIKPRLGKWTLPAGFMENHETVEDCARRESLEEANARIENLRLFSLHSLPHVSQVYVMYSGTLAGGAAAAGAESSSVQLFAPEDLPWDELAFDVIRANLKLYLEHGPNGGAVHTGSVLPHPGMGAQAENSE